MFEATKVDLSLSDYGNIYFLMSPNDLDKLCEGVSDGLLEYGKQHHLRF